jgi:hypothetical protein
MHEILPALSVLFLFLCYCHQISKTPFRRSLEISVYDWWGEGELKYNHTNDIFNYCLE